VPSVLRRIWATPEVSSCAVRVKVTEVVEAVPLFIWIKPVGVVLSSFMLFKVLGVSFATPLLKDSFNRWLCF
jgi:hypothetical protein